MPKGGGRYVGNSTAPPCGKSSGAGHRHRVAAALAAGGGEGVELEGGGGAGDQQAEGAGPGARGRRREGGEDRFESSCRLPGRVCYRAGLRCLAQSMQLATNCMTVESTAWILTLKRHSKPLPLRPAAKSGLACWR